MTSSVRVLRNSTVCRLGFFVFLFSLPFYAFPVYNLSIRAIQFDWVIGIGLLIVFSVASVHRQYGFPLRLDSIIAALLLFNLALVFSLLTPILSETGSVIDFLTTWVQYLFVTAVFIAVTHTHFSREWMHFLLRLYVLIGVCVAGFGLFQFLAFNAFGIEWVYLNPTSVTYVSKTGYTDQLGFARPNSFFAEPRHFGNFLITPFFVLVGSYFEELRLFTSPIELLLSLGMLVGVLLSFSASAYLVLVASTVLFVPFLINRFEKILRLLKQVTLGFAALLFVLVGLSAVGVSEVIIDAILYNFERIVPRKNTLQAILSLDLEFLAGNGTKAYLGGVVASLLLLSSHPLFGIGLNQFYLYYPGMVIVPPVDLLVSVGLPGTVAFVLFLMQLARNTFQLRDYVSDQTGKSLLKIALIFICIAVLKSMFGSKYNYVSTWFWADIMIAGLIYYNLLARGDTVS